jgi:hypothetical protein
METEGSLPHSQVLRLHSVGNRHINEQGSLVEWYGRENRSAWSKTWSTASFSTTNPTQTGLESNLVLCCAADGVGHGTTKTPSQLRRMCFLWSLLFELYKVNIITRGWRHSLEHSFPNCVPRSTGGHATWVGFPCAFTNNLLNSESVDSKVNFDRIQYPKQ